MQQVGFSYFYIFYSNVPRLNQEFYDMETATKISAHIHDSKIPVITSYSCFQKTHGYFLENYKKQKINQLYKVTCI